MKNHLQFLIHVQLQVLFNMFFFFFLYLALCLEKLVTNEAEGCLSSEEVLEKEKVSSLHASGHVQEINTGH